MHKIGIFLSSCLVVSAVTGCTSSGPALRLEGALPPAAGYMFSPGEPIAPALRAAIKAELARHGLQESSDPAFLVQAERSSPPARTGTFVPRTGMQAWGRPPAHMRKALVHLSITMSDIGTGKEIFRGEAWQPSSRTSGGPAALVGAILVPDPGAVQARQ